MEIYKSKITYIGPLVTEFLEENILVFFYENAPEELAEFSILHDNIIGDNIIKVGDIFAINENKYEVLAVGNVVNKNFKELGHLIIRFNGKKKASLPGDVCVTKETLPLIKEGDSIRFLRIT